MPLTFGKPVTAELGDDGYVTFHFPGPTHYTHFWATRISGDRLAVSALGEGGWFNVGRALTSARPTLISGLGPIRAIRFEAPAGASAASVNLRPVGGDDPGPSHGEAASISATFDGDTDYTSEPLVMNGRTNLAFTAVATGDTIAGSYFLEGDQFDDVWVGIPVEGSPAEIAITVAGTETEVLAPVPYLRARYRWDATDGNSGASSITASMSAA